MSNEDMFGFFPITEAATQHAGFVACELAHEFSEVSSSYGDGVKSITATLILTDPQGLGTQQEDTVPEFLQGLRRVEVHGITVDIEDELVFAIRPEFTALVGAVDRAKVASAIVSALFDVHTQLCNLSIPNFDIRRFLSDLESFFSRIGQGSDYELAGSATDAGAHHE